MSVRGDPQPGQRAQGECALRAGTHVRSYVNRFTRRATDDSSEADSTVYDRRSTIVVAFWASSGSPIPGHQFTKRATCCGCCMHVTTRCTCTTAHPARTRRPSVRQLPQPPRRALPHDATPACFAGAAERRAIRATELCLQSVWLHPGALPVLPSAGLGRNPNAAGAPMHHQERQLQRTKLRRLHLPLPCVHPAL